MTLRPHHIALSASLAALVARGLILEACASGLLLLGFEALDYGRRTVGGGSWREYLRRTCM